MRFHFTKHAQHKLRKVKQAGFSVSENKVEQTIINPIKVENREDGTYIATTLLDKTHVLRVVYRQENDIIIVITFYPGRRKVYEV